MLNQYLQRTQQLISDVKQEVANPLFLTSFINTARGQLAGEAECIRVQGTATAVIGQVQYAFSSINLAINPSPGVEGTINIRSIRYSLQTGNGATLWIPGKPWEWFNLYYANNAAPGSGPPEVWSQYGQGAAPGNTGSVGTGSFFISPFPDVAYPLICDCVCYPAQLVDNTTVEAIPYLWTDAVPYFAAYLAYLYVQNTSAAGNMMEMYQTFVQRARRASTPSVNSWQYEQADDPAQLSKFAKPGAA